MMRLMPRLLVPKFGVMDQEIEVKAVNLSPNQPVTVASYLNHYDTVYIAFAHFFTNAAGCANLAEFPSLGGTYFGRKKMGIFTSARALLERKGFRRLIAFSVKDQFNYELTCWPGHFDFEFFQKYGHFKTARDWSNILCRAEVVRSYLASGITRVPVEGAASVRGTLFIPPGRGPFPAIIDIFGGIGSCVESRAALLAQKGYLTLALGYLNFADLPVKSFLDIKMDYFIKAVGFISNHSQVDSKNIAMVSTCLSTAITTNLALREPRIKAIACINAPNFINLDSESDFLIPENMHREILSHYVTDSFDFRQGKLECVRNDAVTANPIIIAAKPLKLSHHVDLLYLISDDQGMPSIETAEFVKKYFTDHGKGDLIKIKRVKNQGHLMEPPYTPLADVVPFGGLECNAVINYGGNARNHEESQKEGWDLLTDFLQEKLQGSRSKL